MNLEEYDETLTVFEPNFKYLFQFVLVLFFDAKYCEVLSMKLSIIFVMINYILDF